MPFIPPLPVGTIFQPPCFLIEKEGKMSYLLGTLHCLPLNIIPANLLASIKSANNLVLESLTNPPFNSKDEIESLLIKIGFISRTASLTKWYEKLTPTALEIVENARKIFFSSESFDLSYPLERIEPSSVLALCHRASIKGGMDDQLKELFVNKIFPLESSEEVIPLLFGKDWALTLEQDLLENYSHLKNIPDYSSMKTEVKYLVGGFLQDFHQIMNTEQDTEIYAIRNVKWFPKILSYHEKLEGPVLFAVGAAHLLGRKGLLHLLQENKFKISVYNAPSDSFLPFDASYLFDQMGETIDLVLGIESLLTKETIPPIAQNVIIDYVGLEVPLVWSKVYPPVVHQPVICLQKKISPDLVLEGVEAPSPPLLMWMKSPTVSSQVLDLNVPPVSSDLVGHKPICDRMLRKDIDI